MVIILDRTATKIKHYGNDFGLTASKKFNFKQRINTAKIRFLYERSQ